MIYQVKMTDEADEDLNEFNKSEKARIIKLINRFALNPLPKLVALFVYTKTAPAA